MVLLCRQYLQRGVSHRVKSVSSFPEASLLMVKFCQHLLNASLMLVKT